MSTSKRLSMISLRLPSFRSEKSSDSKGSSAQVSDVESYVDSPSAGTYSSAASHLFEGEAAAGEGGKKVERRKSRLGLRLSSYVFPSLTSQYTDHLPPQQVRKPLPAHPSAVGDYQPPLDDVYQGSNTGFPDPTLGYEQPRPVYQHHARKASLPNMLKKIRKSSPELGEQHPTSLPPKQSPPIISVPNTSEPQLPVIRRTREGPRSNSHDRFSRNEPHSQHHSRTGSASSTPRYRSSSAQPPTGRAAPSDARVVSTPAEFLGHSRDSSTASLHQPESGKKIKKGWLRSRSSSTDSGKSAHAWIIAPGNTADYNTTFLLNGDRIPELWDETGDMFVFLGTRGGRHGPSFRVTSYVVSSSRVFRDMIQADAATVNSRGRNRERSFGGQANLMAADAHRSFTPTIGAEAPGEANIYLDILGINETPDLERLVAVRNLFAFLTGQPLIGTRKHPSLFSAFLQIAGLLREFGFSSYDGTSFGEAADVAFGSCIEQLGLADVRHSREKTIETLILGEQMRSLDLYTEGFVHAVGKHDTIREIRSPLWNTISTNTRLRVERAHLDLFKRLQNNTHRLESFEIPSLFAGIASSQTSTEYKDVRFKEWQKNFLKMRSFALGYYKDKFGHWPPKARSKKNQFSESGLNRQCLKMLYADMCALYDLLVDRDSVTPRVMDQSPLEIHEASPDPRISALRRILSEYDQSSPPVLPPIPYDVPKLPTMTTIRADYHDLPPKEQAKFDKNIQTHELLLILIKSRNIDTDQLAHVPFLTAFKDFEQREAKGSSPQDLADQRIGYWLFLYVIIQALPMLVVDAPGLRYTDGVEYFLCEPPQGNLPWVEDVNDIRKVWYEVSGGDNIVELSADVVMFSVEATYHRSHCWSAAKIWEAEAAASPLLPANTTTAAQAATFHPGQTLDDFGPLSPLDPPRPGVFQDLDPMASPLSTGSGAGTPPLRARNISPGNQNQTYRSSIIIGLEPLSNPPDARSDRSGSRPRSSASGNARIPKSGSAGNLVQLAKDSAGESETVVGGSTFDDILAGIEREKEGTGKRRKGFF